MFYFEQLFQTALKGIDSANVTGAVLSVAGTILLLGFLWGAYQAFATGGDVRMLASSGIRYLILGLVFANYGTVFREVNGMFNSVADFIYNSTGMGDLFANWMSQLAQYWQANGNASVWNLVTGLASGVISLLVILSAFVIFPVCYLVFAVFYAMYGSVLYVVGPFVLALLPTRGLDQLSRTYLVNLMTFQAWGLVYAVIQVLLSAVNLSSMNAVLNANGVLNSFVGSSQMMLLALTAILFSFSIALIPFIASRIVRGDVGSTMMTLVKAATTTASAAAGMAAASLAGAAAGAAAAQAASGAAPSSPPAVSSFIGSGTRFAWPSPAAGAGTGAVASSQVPPPRTSVSAEGTSASSSDGVATEAGSATPGSPAAGSSSPAHSRSRPGVYRGLSLPRAVAWRAGYSIGKTFKHGEDSR